MYNSSNNKIINIKLEVSLISIFSVRFPKRQSLENKCNSAHLYVSLIVCL